MSGKAISLDEIPGQALSVMAMWRDGWSRQQMADFFNNNAVPVLTEGREAGEGEQRWWTVQSIRNLIHRCIRAGIDPGEESARELLERHMRIGAQSEYWPIDWKDDEPLIQLPEVDYTDDGFNWTQEELEEATRQAREILFRDEE